MFMPLDKKPIPLKTNMRVDRTARGLAQEKIKFCSHSLEDDKLFWKAALRFISSALSKSDVDFVLEMKLVKNPFCVQLPNGILRTYTIPPQTLQLVQEDEDHLAVVYFTRPFRCVGKDVFNHTGNFLHVVGVRLLREYSK
jgi:hypothetical protein